MNSESRPERIAKVNEYIKTHNIKPLDANELEQVSGGEELGVNVYGTWMSEKEFNELIMGITKEFGYTVGLQMFKDITNCPDYSCGTMPGDSDLEHMDVMLNTFWANCKRNGYMPEWTTKIG